MSLQESGGANQVLVHKMPLFHGRGGADWVLVHEMPLFHGS